MFVYHLFYQVTEERCELGLTRLGRVLKVGSGQHSQTQAKNMYTVKCSRECWDLYKGETKEPPQDKTQLYTCTYRMPMFTFWTKGRKVHEDHHHHHLTRAISHQQYSFVPVCCAIKTGLNYHRAQGSFISPFFKVVRLFPVTTGTNDVTCNCDSFRVMCRCCGWPVLFLQLPSGLYYRRQRWCAWVQVLYLY